MRELAARGIRVGLARAKQDLLLQLERGELLQLIGEDMVFPTLPTALEAYGQAQADAAEGGRHPGQEQ